MLGTIEGKGAVLGRDGALGVARRRGRRHDAAGRGGPDSGGDVGRGVTRFDGVLITGEQCLVVDPRGRLADVPGIDWGATDEREGSRGGSDRIRRHGRTDRSSERSAAYRNFVFFSERTSGGSV